MEQIETGNPPDMQALLAELRRYGVGYLMGEATELAERGFQLQPAEFVAALARSSVPRVRDAFISLLLLHPDLANVTKDAIETARPSGDEQTAEQLTTLALAALYLQRVWRETLSLVGVSVQMPEELFGAYWRERGLPAPRVNFGEAGLRALAEWERRRTRLGANYASDWDNQVDHLVLQEWRRSSENENTAAPVEILWPRMAAPEMAPLLDPGEDAMSMRPNVTRADIEQFLNDLGAMAQTSGRIYLAGGAALVHS